MKTTTLAIWVSVLSTLATAAEVQEPVWREDVTNVPIPSIPAQGRVHGVEFRVERARLKGDMTLELRQGKGFFANHAFTIFFRVPSLKSGAFLEGKTYVVKREDTLPMVTPNISVPTVIMSYRVEGNRIPLSMSFRREYTMKLQFGRLAGNKLPGRIYLCLPDASKSFVAGTFDVDVGPNASATPLKLTKPSFETFKERFERSGVLNKSNLPPEVRKQLTDAIKDLSNRPPTSNRRSHRPTSRSATRQHRR
ncbi:MAG: hypothetical protein ISR77_15580 [Pirellulaceae bacterium]|nr:hypothetical protein [Pirellulaceae bacterium]